MRVLRMADAPPVGKWDEEAWARIIEADHALDFRVAGEEWAIAKIYFQRYTPAELARVVFGRWPS